MSQNLFLIGLFLSAGALAYLLARSLLTRRTPPPPPVSEDGPPPDPMAPELASLIPARKETQRLLQRLLWTAGFYRPSALMEYLAIRAVLVLGCALATALIALQVQEHLIPTAVLLGGMVTGLAYSLPRLVLGGLASSRGRQLRRGLPTAMDVIGLCLTAGQNLLGSLEITSRELAPANPAMAQELGIVFRQAQMHSLELALTQWANRIDVAEIRSFVLLLVQSEKLGTDMVTTLLEFADNHRTLMRQQAEAHANRTNMWILFPSIFCLWVASLIIMVAPAYLEFAHFRRETLDKYLRSAKGEIEKSNPQGNRPAAEAGAEAPAPQPAPMRREVAPLPVLPGQPR